MSVRMQDKVQVVSEWENVQEIAFKACIVVHTIVKSDIANFCYKSVPLKQNISEFNNIRAYVNKINLYIFLNSYKYSLLKLEILVLLLRWR